MNYEELDLKANLGAFSTLDAECIMPEVEKLKKGEVYLEVGVDKGKSLSIARMVNDKCDVFGVDLRPDPKVPNTTFLQGDSVDVALLWSSYYMRKISVLFIDGDHSYEGCKRDIEAWVPHMKKGGIIFFHDCDESSPGVVQAVAEAYQKYGINWKLFKRTDKNTSVAAIWLK